MRKIIILLSFIFCTLISFGQINVGTNYHMKAQLPIDSRFVFENVSDRDSLDLNFRYEGLITYTKLEQTNWQLIGGITNSNWRELFSSDTIAPGGAAGLWEYKSDSSIINNNPYGQVRIKTLSTYHTIPPIYMITTDNDSNILSKYPITYVPPGDTLRDTLCNGTIIYDMNTGTYWQHIVWIDTVQASPTYGDTLGCIWIAPFDSVTPPVAGYWKRSSLGLVSLVYPDDNVGIGIVPSTDRLEVKGTTKTDLLKINSPTQTKTAKILYYNPSTKEVTYGDSARASGSGIGGAGFWDYDLDSNIVNTNRNGHVKIDSIDLITGFVPYYFYATDQTNNDVIGKFPIITEPPPVGDTLNWDTLCAGLSIYFPGDSSVWQKIIIYDSIGYDSITGIIYDTVASGCTWVNLSKAQWLWNGTTLYYNGGKVAVGTKNPVTKLYVNGDFMSYDTSHYSQSTVMANRFGSAYIYSKYRNVIMDTTIWESGQYSYALIGAFSQLTHKKMGNTVKVGLFQGDSTSNAFIGKTVKDRPGSPVDTYPMLGVPNTPWGRTYLRNLWLQNLQTTSDTSMYVLISDSATGATYRMPIRNLLGGGEMDSTTISAGTAISVTGTRPAYTITNTAPDRTVVLNDGTGINVTGTYPTFTITNTGVTSPSDTNLWVTSVGNLYPKNITSNVSIGTITPLTTFAVDGSLRIQSVEVDSATHGLHQGIDATGITNLQANIVYNSGNSSWYDWNHTTNGHQIADGYEGQIITLKSVGSGKLYLRNDNAMGDTLPSFIMSNGDNVTMQFTGTTWVEIGRVDFGEEGAVFITDTAFVYPGPGLTISTGTDWGTSLIGSDGQIAKKVSGQWEAVNDTMHWYQEISGNLTNNNSNGNTRIKSLSILHATVPEFLVTAETTPENLLTKYPVEAIINNIPVGDTLGWDAICAGIQIYNTSDSSVWAKRPVIDINGDTIGCEWFQPTPAEINWHDNQTLVYYRGTVGITNGNNVKLPLFSTSDTSRGMVPGSASVSPAYYLNSQGTWAIPSGSAYTAGYRMNLVGAQFNNTSYWKDQDTLNVGNGILLSTSKKITPLTGTNGQSLRWISGVPQFWPDSVGAGSTYLAGYRMGLSGTTFNNLNYHNTIDSVSSSIPYTSTLTKVVMIDTVTGKLYRKLMSTGGTSEWTRSGNLLTTLNANDSVGIGVTPAYRLDIGQTGRMRAGAYIIGATFALSKTTNHLEVGKDGAITSAALYTNNLPRLWMTVGGNVGIGITAPIANLDLLGDARVDSLRIDTKNVSTSDSVLVTDGIVKYRMLSLQNTSVQNLTNATDSTQDWNVSSGTNAIDTLSHHTTITLSNLVAGTSGNLTITNAATVKTLTFAGYTNKISPAIYVAANQVVTSGDSKIDVFSWYYDGVYLIWNGTNDYQ